jgi:uncharacterized membrane protein YcaP (DUF421 family)
METVLRIAVAYVVIMAGFRIMGKRELSQLSPFELVTLLLIPEIFSQAIVGEDFSMVNAVIATATLLSLVFLTSVLAHLSRRFGSLVEAQPSVLVAHGAIVEENMNRERITADELYSELRLSGLEDLSQVKWAILESDGKISIVRTDARSPNRQRETSPAR